MGVNLLQGAGGAASGAMAGSAIMPGIGTAVGAGVGGLLGLFGGGGQSAAEAAAAQTRANRPDQTNPFGTSNWTEGPNGEWSQNLSFNPQMQGAADSLMTQWGQNAANGYGTGWDAFGQARDAALGTSRAQLDPLWQQRDQALRSQMANQGLDPNSQIAVTQSQTLGDQRGRDYQGAANAATSQGFAAQGQMFNQNRQQWLDPLNALTGMNGLLQMPNVPGAGNYQVGQMNDQQSQADAWGGIGDLASTFARPGQGGAPGATPQGVAPQPFSFGGGDNGLGMDQPFNFAGQLQMPRLSR